MNAALRHLILAVLAAVLGVVGVEYVPFLDSLHTQWAPVLTVVIGALLAVLTPLVKSYGIGASPVIQRAEQIEASK